MESIQTTDEPNQSLVFLFYLYYQQPMCSIERHDKEEQERAIR